MSAGTIEPKTTIELRIRRGALVAGVLSRTARGCRFQFSDEFLDNPTYSELSYCMPKTRRAIEVTGTNLHPFFAGLLPEGLRLKALVRTLKTSEDDLFSLFAASGAQCVGDVYADAQNWAVVDRAPKLSEVDFYEFFERLLAKGARIDEAIAGVQEKISASMISFPPNIARRQKAYILKLNPRDKPNLVENEFWCLELARKCGIPVNRAKLVKDRKGNRALLVQRFDRIYDEQQRAFQRVHQEDACQFLNRYPADKYRLSINDIAKRIEELAAAPRLEILNLLRLYCFSYLIGNGDLHAKNISLRTRPGGNKIELTPAYDLISTTIYGDHKMALKIDGRDDRITGRMIRAFGARFGIPERAIETMLRKLTLAVKKSAGILDHIPMTERELRHLNRVMQTRLRELESS